MAPTQGTSAALAVQGVKVPDPRVLLLAEPVQEEERDPMFVCRLLVALAAQHPADAAAPIPSQKQVR